MSEDVIDMEMAKKGADAFGMSIGEYVGVLKATKKFLHEDVTAMGERVDPVNIINGIDSLNLNKKQSMLVVFGVTRALSSMDPFTVLKALIRDE